MTSRRAMSEYEFWVRVLRMAAAVIGAVGALWLLSGDRDPAAMHATLDPGIDYSQIVTIEHRDTFDRDGVFFFGLRFPDGGYVVISADDDLAFSQFLIHHAGRRVQLALRDITTTPPDVGRHKDGSREQ